MAETKWRVYRSLDDPSVWEDVQFLMSKEGGECSNREIAERLDVGIYALEKRVGVRRQYDDRREFA